MAKDVLAASAEHRLRSTVPLEDAAGAIDRNERVPSRLQDRAQQLLAASQGLLRVPGLGDVGQDTEPQGLASGSPPAGGGASRSTGTPSLARRRYSPTCTPPVVSIQPASSSIVWVRSSGWIRSIQYAGSAIHSSGE